jgi:hypothetical protein
MLFTTVATFPSATVAEPTYKVNNTDKDSNIVKSVKAEIDTFALPTKEDTAEKQIEKYVKKLAEDKKKKAEAAAKKKAKEEAARKAARVVPVVSSNTSVPGSNACVVAMKKVFPEHLWKVGYAIMRAESGARPNAIGGPNYNGTYDYGCWQINNTPSALNPDRGAQIALYKYNHSGWYPWTVYKTGKYLRFM